MQLPGFCQKGCFFVLLCLLTVFFSSQLMGAESKEAPDPVKKATAKNPSYLPIRLIGGVPEVLPIPGDARPYAESRFAEEIDRALAFMIFKYRDPGRWFWLVLLDYMQRQYDLPERYKLKYNESAKVIAEDQEMRDLLLRIADPEYLIPLEQIEEAPKDMYFLARCVYCCEYPIDDDFVGDMVTCLEKEEEVILSPFALSALMLRQNQCIANTHNQMILRSTVGVRYRNIIQERGVFDSFFAEALAMLPLLGYSDMIDENTLSEAVSCQNEDGGWPALFKEGTARASAPAPTIYMLWAMLQDALPDVEEVKLVPVRPEPASKQTKMRP